MVAAMSLAILMCGLAFSGKTSVARQVVASLGCLSLDDINDERGLWGGHGIPVEEWQRTHEVAHDRLRQSLRRHQCVVVDDTNNLRWLRDRLRDVAIQEGHTAALVYVKTPLEEIAARMQRAAEFGNRRVVESDVFEQHSKSFEEPTYDESPIVHRVGDDVDGLTDKLRHLAR